MNEVIEQAAVAVAAVLDQSVWALESTEIVGRLSGLEDIATMIRVAQAGLAHELAGRDWPKTHGSTSTANFLRDHLRVSGTAAERLLKLGAILDRREAMGPAMSPGSRARALSGPLGLLAAEARAAAAATTAAPRTPVEPTLRSRAPTGDRVAGADAAARRSGGAGAGDESIRATLTIRWPAEPIVGIAVNPEQALVIGNIMKNLPGDLDPKVVDTCEAELIKLAAVYEPSLLRSQGEKILDYIAPEIADEALAAETRPGRSRRPPQTRLHHPRRRQRHPQPLRPPRHRERRRRESRDRTLVQADPRPATDGERDPRLAEQRRADALIDVCRLALTTDTLPDNGGQRPQLNVTVKYDTLTKELAAGTLDIGGQLSPTTVRRLACDALILPAVLGSHGEILDLGRQRRLFTGAVRRAIILRDGGCAFPGCDRPPSWCEVHHWMPWHKGGTTRAHRRRPSVLPPPPS